MNSLNHLFCTGKNSNGIASSTRLASFFIASYLACQCVVHVTSTSQPMLTMQLHHTLKINRHHAYTGTCIAIATGL